MAVKLKPILYRRINAASMSEKSLCVHICLLMANGLSNLLSVIIYSSFFMLFLFSFLGFIGFGLFDICLVISTFLRLKMFQIIFFCFVTAGYIVISHFIVLASFFST